LEKNNADNAKDAVSKINKQNIKKEIHDLNQKVVENSEEEKIEKSKITNSSGIRDVENIINDSKRYSNKIINTLTNAQKSRLNLLENTINDHLTKGDFSDTLRDLQGNPVPNGKGGYFDHLKEMKNSYISLNKIKKALEGSLRNPNLFDIDRELLQEGLDKANFYISKIQELFKLYRGIE